MTRIPAVRPARTPLAAPVTPAEQQRVDRVAPPKTGRPVTFNSAA